LLEAMQEKAISYSAERYELPKPFFVLATQNPVEQAGTYPLPEAQLDRFLMYVSVGYPTAEDEVEILRRTTGTQEVELQKILSAADIIVLQRLVREVEISEPLLSYVSQLARNTRTNTDLPSVSDTVNQFVQWGAGPRAGQALVLCAKAKALIDGRFAATLDDIQAVAYPVLRHRMLLNFQAEAQNITADQVISALLNDVQTPASPLSS
ncbi:MAG TPA: AAA family ATPase, partial [Alteromonas sp.]|nr:AAA family ATPase [Alteromonas sp.]